VLSMGLICARPQHPYMERLPDEQLRSCEDGEWIHAGKCTPLAACRELDKRTRGPAAWRDFADHASSLAKTAEAILTDVS
jgi:hypothetical protein